MEDFIRKKAILFDIVNRYQNKISELYEKATEEGNCILMSRNNHPSIYGMFHPDKDLKYAVLEDKKAKLTNDPSKMEFRYFFDKNGFLVLTEKYDYDYSGNFIKLNDIFFIRGEEYIDIVFWGCSEQRINAVGRIQYANGKIHSFMETKYISLAAIKNNNLYDNFSYMEYIYNYKEHEIELLLEQNVMWKKDKFTRKQRREIHKIDKT